VLLVGVSAACGSGGGPRSDPRPIIVPSGERIRPEPARMDSVYEWVTREQLNIEQDPSFWVIAEPADEDPYPWEGLDVRADSVTVQVPRGMQDPQLVFMIYGHLHLMSEMGRLDEWLPEAPNAQGFELERAILSRAADAWILGRSVYNTAPYAPLDELAYAKEAGFLVPFIFTARPNEFAAARAAWVRENPGEMERYRQWFLDTFSREPPGLRAA
jgi:hypothetical protein